MIDIEEQLADHLARVAAQAVPRHNLDAVMGEEVVVRLRQPPRHPAAPRWRAGIAAVAAVGLATAVVIALRSNSHVATTVAPGATANSTCQVFISPDASTTVIEGIGDRLRQRPEVINLQLVSQQQAYEEFLRLFAGKDDLTRSVTADILPSKWTFDLDPDTAANQQAITAELGNDPAVKQAKCM